jgi:hypothetical protein
MYISMNVQDRTSPPSSVLTGRCTARCAVPPFQNSMPGESQDILAVFCRTYTRPAAAEHRSFSVPSNGRETNCTLRLGRRIAMQAEGGTDKFDGDDVAVEKVCACRVWIQRMAGNSDRINNTFLMNVQFVENKNETNFHLQTRHQSCPRQSSFQPRCT